MEIGSQEMHMPISWKFIAQHIFMDH